MIFTFSFPEIGTPVLYRCVFCKNAFSDNGFYKNFHKYQLILLYSLNASKFFIVADFYLYVWYLYFCVLYWVYFFYYNDVLGDFRQANLIQQPSQYSLYFLSFYGRFASTALLPTTNFPLTLRATIITFLIKFYLLFIPTKPCTFSLTVPGPIEAPIM